MRWTQHQPKFTFLNVRGGVVHSALCQITKPLPEWWMMELGSGSGLGFCCSCCLCISMNITLNEHYLPILEIISTTTTMLEMDFSFQLQLTYTSLDDTVHTYIPSSCSHSIGVIPRILARTGQGRAGQARRETGSAIEDRRWGWGDMTGFALLHFTWGWGSGLANLIAYLLLIAFFNS